MTGWLAEARRGGSPVALPYPTGHLCLSPVIRLTRHLAARLCSALCVALMLVSANASTANVVDQLQHQSTATGGHEHLAFSKIVFQVDDHQHDAYEPDPGDSDKAPDHQPGTGHHHHVDNGSGLFTPMSHEASWILSRASLWRPAVDARVPGFVTNGPERPPKSSALQS